MGIEQLHQLGEVGQRPREAVDLVDHHHIHVPVPNVGQELLEGGSVHGTA
jgi:hypothetical protein